MHAFVCMIGNGWQERTSKAIFGQLWPWWIENWNAAGVPVREFPRELPWEFESYEQNIFQLVMRNRHINIRIMPNEHIPNYGHWALWSSWWRLRVACRTLLTLASLQRKALRNVHRSRLVILRQIHGPVQESESESLIEWRSTFVFKIESIT